MANIKIDIAKNGLTTLATAGKYCDRNVDVEVNVAGGGDIEVEPIVLTGNCIYACSGPINSAYINMYGNTISTDKVNSAEQMFANYKYETIPFEINIDNWTYWSLSSMFFYCINLKELPKINNAYPSSMSGIFQFCNRLRIIPEDYFNSWNFSRMQSYATASWAYLFNNCYSLRKIPKYLLDNMWGIQTSYSYSPYNNTFNLCYSLDEVRGMSVRPGNLTSNLFYNTFTSAGRLKDFTFAVNEDGTPKTAKWKNQTIDLSSYVGYVLSGTRSYILNYNSGITADKEVKDDATYQALKNDPDWFSADINYSRYNHDSAVNTINSLPDCSATGTNTIKFMGSAGALTDGGAINTLTEEEIAVAVAKGWGVSFV